MPIPRPLQARIAKPRRGRPPEEGYTKTAAERARNYRARRKRAGIVVHTFDPREVRRARVLTAGERQELRDALQKISHYRAEIKRLSALNAKIRQQLNSRTRYPTP